MSAQRARLEPTSRGLCSILRQAHTVQALLVARVQQTYVSCGPSICRQGCHSVIQTVPPSPPVHRLQKLSGKNPSNSMTPRHVSQLCAVSCSTPPVWVNLARCCHTGYLTSCDEQFSRDLGDKRHLLVHEDGESRVIFQASYGGPSIPRVRQRWHKRVRVHQEASGTPECSSCSDGRKFPLSSSSSASIQNGMCRVIRDGYA